MHSHSGTMRWKSIERHLYAEFLSKNRQKLRSNCIKLAFDWCMTRVPTVVYPLYRYGGTVQTARGCLDSRATHNTHTTFDTLNDYGWMYRRSLARTQTQTSESANVNSQHTTHSYTQTICNGYPLFRFVYSIFLKYICCCRRRYCNRIAARIEFLVASISHTFVGVFQHLSSNGAFSEKIIRLQVDLNGRKEMLQEPGRNIQNLRKLFWMPISVSKYSHLSDR